MLSITLPKMQTETFSNLLFKVEWDFSSECEKMFSLLRQYIEKSHEQHLRKKNLVAVSVPNYAKKSAQCSLPTMVHENKTDSVFQDRNGLFVVGQT